MNKLTEVESMLLDAGERFLHNLLHRWKRGSKALTGPKLARMKLLEEIVSKIEVLRLS